MITMRTALVALLLTTTGCSPRAPTPAPAPAAGAPEVMLRLDDTGMNHAVNMAVERVAEAGIPFSTSVLFVAPWYQEAVEVLKAHPEVSVGVHLALNSEWEDYRWGPVLGAGGVPSLVDSAGYFHHSVAAFLESSYDLDEVERELNAQVERALRSGLRIDYIDYHMRTAVATPELRAIVERIAARHGLGMSFYYGETSHDLWSVPPEEKAARLAEVGELLDPDRPNLVILHVAERTPAMDALVDANAPQQNARGGGGGVARHRDAELQALLSPALAAWARTDRARLTTYRELIAREGLDAMNAPTPAGGSAAEATPGEATPGEAVPSRGQRPGPDQVYVGTASGDPENGIHVFRFDPDDGSLATARVDVTPVANPSFLALAPDGRTLYAVSEVEEGEVVAYRRDASSGGLTELERASSGGAGPAYVSVHPAGRHLLVANYGGGTVALLPIADDGAPGEPVDVVQHRGSGPNAARQEAPHPHYVRTDPAGRRALVADLGIDQVVAYPLHGFGEERAMVTHTAPGAGPRHLAFHPDGSVAYLVNELHGSVTAWSYDPETGVLTELQTVSTLPDEFDGENKSAAIHVHPNGRWLYVSNRGDFDSIALFAIDPASGRLTPRGHQREGFEWPRSFAIHPDGRWLLVANRHAHEVRVFEVDAATGELTDTGTRVEVPDPTHVLLAPGG